MNLIEFENEFRKLPSNYKTKDIDQFNRKLIKQKIDVSFLKDIILVNQQYHRTYFQVSLARLLDIDKKLDFIEENFDKLQDWWHVDQLPQFVDYQLTFDIALSRAKTYIYSNMPFARRWGYVIFMPTLVKEKDKAIQLFDLLKNDDEYYVQMAEAWLLSYLAVYLPEETFTYLDCCQLEYNIVGKAIQKICDSFRIDANTKNRFKELRKKYKK